MRGGECGAALAHAGEPKKTPSMDSPARLAFSTMSSYSAQIRSRGVGSTPRHRNGSR